MSKQGIAGFVIEEINPIIGEIPFPEGTFPNDVAEKVAFDAYHAAEKTAMTSPFNWVGSISRELSQVDWSPDVVHDEAIPPSRALFDFGFNSVDLPDVGSSRIYGRTNEPNDIFGFPDDGPLQDSAVFDELNRLRDNDFVRRNAAVPSIAVPIPFDAAVLLDRIRAHVATWTGKQLLDPAFAAQLDRYLVSAADAYRRNQIKAGKEHIETLREMLEREHKDLDHDDDENENGKRAERNGDHRAATGRSLIDRLAARILDFDLKYVLKRTERENDDHKKH